MELTDASRRILGQHWRLIALCVLISVVAVAFIVPRAPTYTASARLVMDAPDPQTNSETAGISDTAQAIATSPAQIAAAMHDAGIKNRDPVAIGRNAVSVAALGESAVVSLSVSDRDPRVAAALANAIAARVISTRLAVTRGQASQVTNRLNQQIASIDRQIASADVAIDELTIRLASTQSPQDANALRAKHDDAVRQRDLLDQTRSSLASQRINLLSTGALQRNPSVISPATAPLASDSSGLVPDLVLGAFLGLIVGVGIASVIEALRPKLIGSAAIAREFDVPVLGTLSRQPSEAAPAELGPLALRLRLAGKAAGLPNLRLVPVDEGTDLGEFARWLDDSGPVSREALNDPGPARVALEPAIVGREGHAPGAVAAESQYRIRPFDPESVLMNGASVGFVLVAPDRLAKSELEAATHLLRFAPGQLLGVVTYPQRRRVRLRDRARKSSSKG